MSSMSQRSCLKSKVTANEVKVTLGFPCAQECFAQMQNAGNGVVCVKGEVLCHAIKYFIADRH